MSMAVIFSELLKLIIHSSFSARGLLKIQKRNYKKKKPTTATTIITFVAIKHFKTTVSFTKGLPTHHENVGEYYGTKNVRLLADVIAFEWNKCVSGPWQ